MLSNRHAARLPLMATMLAGLATAASAQYAAEPFHDWTVEESRAFGLEMIAARLMLAETLTPPFDEEIQEQLEGMAGPLFARFGGTLAANDPDLAEALRTALEAVAEGEGDRAEAVAAARTQLDAAREVVVPAEAWEAPGFRGALVVDLLLAEGGVAEGYEEAVENVWEYPGGWAALQRVDMLWTGIEPLASEERRADAEEMLAALHDLFPDAGPPESVVGWNPEEAEAPAQRLAGIVEEVVQANLFPGRDLGGLARHLSETVSGACAGYASGDDAVADESLIAAFDLYESELAGTASLFAADAHEEVEALFSALTGVTDDDEGEEEGAEEDAPDEGPEASALSPEAACGDLADTLVEVGGALGG